jgi:hypothetical protein
MKQFIYYMASVVNYVLSVCMLFQSGLYGFRIHYLNKIIASNYYYFLVTS